MKTGKRGKPPSDFELVFGEGIHPFYLGMEPDQVFEAAVGWRIVELNREDSTIQVHFEKGGRIIEVSLINTVWLFPGFNGDYRTYYIWTEDARFANGKRLCKMKNSNILSRFAGEHALTLDEDYDVEGNPNLYGHYKNEGTLLLLTEGLKPSLSVMLRDWEWEKLLDQE
ncbi:MAG: hypothetical protein RLZZ444_173 [Pseudomonadota bacterium]|jgi:hypothetical protein